MLKEKDIQDKLSQDSQENSSEVTFDDDFELELISIDDITNPAFRRFPKKWRYYWIAVRTSEHALIYVPITQLESTTQTAVPDLWERVQAVRTHRLPIGAPLPLLDIFRILPPRYARFIEYMKHPLRYMDVYVIPKRKKIDGRTRYRVVFDLKKAEAKAAYKMLNAFLQYLYDLLPFSPAQFGGIPKRKPFNLITTADLMLTYHPDGERLKMHDWAAYLEEQLRDRRPGEVHVMFPRKMIHIDLKDFFHTKHFRQFRRQVNALGLSDGYAARQLAQIIFTGVPLKVRTPHETIEIPSGSALQGLPTSTMATAIASYALVQQLTELVDQYDAHFIAWVDDYKISIPPWMDDATAEKLLKEAKEIIRRYGYNVHTKPPKAPRILPQPQGIMSLLFSPKGEPTGYIRPSRRARRLARLFRHIQEKGETINNFTTPQLNGLKAMYLAYVDTTADPEEQQLYKDALRSIEYTLEIRRTQPLKF